MHKSKQRSVCLGVCPNVTMIFLLCAGLVHVLRNHPEVQFVVLSNIATLAAKRKQLFAPFLKNFFILSTDPVRTLTVQTQPFHATSPAPYTATRTTLELYQV